MVGSKARLLRGAFKSFYHGVDEEEKHASNVSEVRSVFESGF